MFSMMFPLRIKVYLQFVPLCFYLYFTTGKSIWQLFRQSDVIFNQPSKLNYWLFLAGVFSETSWYLLYISVMCDDNGLALSLDLQDTMDSLELESFLGDSSLPPTQPDPSMVAHQRRQLKTESKSHVEQLEEQTLYTTSEGVACTNIMNVDFARETQISSQNHMKNVPCSPGNNPQQPQRVATSVSSTGPANVLSAPLQIDGQLIQTTDAKTGQTYWLIVPNSNNQQANVASSPMKHVDNTLQEMQQQTNNIASTVSFGR